MIQAFLRLIGFTLLGYLIFSPRSLRERLLPALTFAVVNVLFPLYSITRYGMNWDSAVRAGGSWLVWFFFIGIGTLFIQYVLGRCLLLRPGVFPALRDAHRREFLLLFSIHNAGYIPLPILQAIAPPEVTVYMFSYVLAFQLVFWSLAVSIFVGGGRTDGGGQTDGGGCTDGGEQTADHGAGLESGGRASLVNEPHRQADARQSPRIRFKLTMPLAGLAAGLILASSGVYQLMPRALLRPLEIISGYAMDGVLVVLGGILAGIPHQRLGEHREFVSFIYIRQLAFPAAVLGLMLVLRLIFAPAGLASGRPIGIGDTWRWLQLVLVLEAAVPPATNLAIAARAYGSREQLEYTGTGLILSYLASAAGIPLFVVLAMLL